MHYKNGREAKNGDKVFSQDRSGNVSVGVLYDVGAGNDSCSGKLVVIAPGDPCLNLKECLLLDDVRAILAVVDFV